LAADVVTNFVFSCATVTSIVDILTEATENGKVVSNFGQFGRLVTEFDRLRALLAVRAALTEIDR
jgi:hypothetical protein